MATTLTHLELKTFVETALTGLLGTYTHPTGVLPAIALLPHPQFGYYFPPDNWRISGIETLIIRSIPTMRDAKQKGGGDLSFCYHWKFVLKQHDLGGDLHTAMDTLLVALAQSYNIAPNMGGYVPPNKEKLIPASAVVSIVDPVMVANV